MRHYYYVVNTYNLDMHTKFLAIYQAFKMYLVLDKTRLFILILSDMYNNYAKGGAINFPCDEINYANLVMP